MDDPVDQNKIATPGRKNRINASNVLILRYVSLNY